MAPRKKTREQRASERFASLYRIGKAKTGMKDTDVMKLLGIGSTATLDSRKKHPERFTFGELVKLAAAFRWSDEEVAEMICGGD